MEKLEALVTEVTFRNDENGFTVLQVRLDNGQRTSAIGIMPDLGAGERVRLSAEWQEHHQYGKQLKVTLCEVIKPTTERGIERYLASGLIKGIGPSTAKRIVEQFGADALDILQFDPERLSEIDGIGKKRAAMIGASFAQQQQMREAMVFLQTYGVSPTLAVKIHKRYGEMTQKIIRDNPYQLVEDIEGIGFKTADRIAASLGIAPDAPQRLRAGLLYALSEASASGGHTYLPKEGLIEYSARLLGAEAALMTAALENLVLEKQLTLIEKEEHTAVYLPATYRAETETARRLLELHEALPYHPDDTLDSAIRRWQALSGVTLNSEQKKAVRSAATEGVSVITGGPGTGKTTIIRCILSLLDGYDVVLAAPTGRAAKRMSEATGYEAKTLHRLLEYGGEEGAFAKNADNPIEADVIVVDEMSMVDIFLMRAFLRAVIPGTKIILVGDANQLPSVGAGNVLGDILRSEVLPVVWLQEIYRQDEQSMIVVNAHRINQGEMPILNHRKGDFFLERCDSGVKASQAIVGLAAERLPKFLGVDALHDIQVLSPMKKGECGVYALNALLQSRFNPADRGTPECVWGETTFRCGDKVMQTRNDYQMEWKRPLGGGQTEEGQGVFNGDMGFILDVDPEDRTVTVRFDDEREAVYEYAQLEDLDLAYCISVHKSQGSEFPAVIIPVLGGPTMLLTRNLFYTGVTRAKRMVVLVGRENAVMSMVHNAHIAKRYSSLYDWLCSAL